MCSWRLATTTTGTACLFSDDGSKEGLCVDFKQDKDELEENETVLHDSSQSEKTASISSAWQVSEVPFSEMSLRVLVIS